MWQVISVVPAAGPAAGYCLRTQLQLAFRMMMAVYIRACETSAASNIVSMLFTFRSSW